MSGIYFRGFSFENIIHFHGNVIFVKIIYVQKLFMLIFNTPKM